MPLSRLGVGMCDWPVPGKHGPCYDANTTIHWIIFADGTFHPGGLLTGSAVLRSTFLCLDGAGRRHLEINSAQVTPYPLHADML
jgi:hypothetical protein